MKAWLITKEYLNKKEEEKIVLILSSRLNSNQIWSYVEKIYPNILSVGDALRFAKNPRDIPYKIKFKRSFGSFCKYEMLCGHNLCIHAYLVDDVKIENEYLKFKKSAPVLKEDVKFKNAHISRPKKYSKEYSKIRLSNIILSNSKN